VFLQDETGQISEKKINGLYEVLFNPRGNQLTFKDDLEDISTGPCPDNGSCLYLGYIGHNKILGHRWGKRIKIAVIREDNFKLSHVVDVKYGDKHKHDAEAMAMHPNGDLYFITKEIPAKIFRLRRERLSNNRGLFKSHVLDYLVKIDLSKISNTSRGQTITSMDISRDGKKLLLATYQQLLQVSLDLAQFRYPTESIKTLDISKVTIRLPSKKLPQIEAASYINEDRGIIYTSEKGRSSKPANNAYYLNLICN